MEDGILLGAHAHAFLLGLPRMVVQRNKHYRPLMLLDSVGELAKGEKTTTQINLRVQRWHMRLSSWLHVTLSRQLLRMHCSHSTAAACFF